MDLGLKGKTALVMGGSQGIGLGIAKTLAAEGARVVIASRSEENLRAAAQEAQGELAICVLDTMDEGSLKRGLESQLAKGPIDILINNTGGPAAGPAAQLPLKAWDAGYQSLLRSVLVSAQLVLPGMAERKWGRILTITSTAALEVIPNLPVSATFRAGLRAWTKSIAREMGRQGVLVNCLLPGPVRTARLDELKHKSPDFYRTMAEETAVGRLGETDEIGRVAAFLCSSANSFITGTSVLADGGYTKTI